MAAGGQGYAGHGDRRRKFVAPGAELDDAIGSSLHLDQLQKELHHVKTLTTHAISALARRRMRLIPAEKLAALTLFERVNVEAGVAARTNWEIIGDDDPDRQKRELRRADFLIGKDLLPFILLPVTTRIPAA